MPGGHTIDTEVLMYNGALHKVQDIHVGDQLMGDNWTPRVVKSLERGKSDMVRVSGQRGSWEPFIVSLNHLLTVQFTSLIERYYSSTSETAEVMITWYERAGNNQPVKYTQTFANVRAADAFMRTSADIIRDGDVMDISIKDLQRWNPKWYIGGKVCLYRPQKDSGGRTGQDRGQAQGPKLSEQAAWRTGFYMESVGLGPGPGPYYGFDLDGNGRYLMADYTVSKC